MAAALNTGRRHRAEMKAVIGGAQRDNFESARVEARHEQGKVDGFGTAVNKVCNPFFITGEPGHQLLGIVCGNRLVVHGRAVGQHIDLFFCLAVHQGMVVADADAKILGHQINIFLILVVP